MSSSSLIDSSHAQLQTVETVAAMFWRVAVQRAPNVAMRWKHLGIWNDIRWSEYADAARAVGCALLACGVQRGDRVAVMSDTRPEWCYVEFGALGSGVSTVGVHSTACAAELAGVVNDSGARLLFVQDQEQLDKALTVLDQMAGIEKILCFDVTGLHAFSHPRVLAFERFCESGVHFHAQNPARWETEVHAARADDIATVAYTSGREGLPKGIMLTHRNLRFQMQTMERICPGKDNDDQLSVLSMSHISERYFSAYRPLEHGAVVHMGSGLSTMLGNLREISPHVLSAVPKVWEKLRATVNMSIADGTPLERWSLRKAMSVGYRVVACRLAGQPVPAGLRAAHFLARALVLNRVLSNVGLRRARLLLSSASPISTDTKRWLQALNLNIVEVYGQTESSGCVSSHHGIRQKVGTVGKAVQGTQVKLAANGEILVHGPHVFGGYMNQPERTAKVLVDGWLHTGDLGSMDSDGNLTLTDRLGDVIHTSTGSEVMPSGIEAQLCTSPLIADAIVIGHGRPFLSCLVLVDHESVAKRAREMKLTFTSFANLTRLKEVRNLVQQEIERVNRDVAGAQTIQRFELIDSEISVLDPDRTPMLQLRRRAVIEKYRSVVEAIYAGA